MEATIFARAKADLEREQYEHHVWQAVTALELQPDVRIATQMTEHRDDAEIRAWLGAIELAARSQGTGDPQVVESELGWAEIGGEAGTDGGQPPPGCTVELAPGERRHAGLPTRQGAGYPDRAWPGHAQRH